MGYGMLAVTGIIRRRDVEVTGGGIDYITGSQIRLEINRFSRFVQIETAYHDVAGLIKAREIENIFQG